MGISLKTHKVLWGRSGGKCAICKNDLIADSADPSDDASIVGEEAHIIARKESFTRGDYESLPPQERDNYSNLILLCGTHHKQIDDQPAHYTVERLRQTKATHEDEVKSRWTEKETKKQQDEIIYAGYIDEWSKRADLDNWRKVCCWVSSADTPTLPTKWYEAQKDFQIWIIGRIWPGRYRKLEQALFNYKAVLQDFLNAFDKHARSMEGDESFLRTRKFYQIDEWNEELYKKLGDQYDAHICLVSDLFFELTRAANYICDHVRDTIFPGYRLREGALLIERHNVGFECKTIHARIEYRGKERTKSPYPGLKEFKKVRYTRDYALDPEGPKPPEREEDN